MNRKNKMRSARLNAMFHARTTKFSRCFDPEMKCQQRAVRAHSVQNARALEYLVNDGHVIAPDLRIDPQSGPQIDLKPTGRNRATTFEGLCSEHDHAIFSPIESSELEACNPEHLFLLAYRATFYEVYATSVVGVQMQSFYQKRMELGIDSRHELSPVGRYAVERLKLAYDTYMYKTVFDDAYLERSFEKITHDVISLDVEQPTLAACALFSLAQSGVRGAQVRVCLSILPISERRTIAVFSYLPEDARYARAKLHRVLESSGAYQKYELSRQLLIRCQNFVLAPRFVNSWSPERRQRILGLFTQTVLEPDLDVEHPDLQLFS